MKETIEFVDDLERKKKLEEFLKQGYRVKCLICGKIYKDTPRKWYEDGHGGRNIEICSCGSDLFINLEEVIVNRCKTVGVKPNADGALVFKEHHFKYCKCDKGKVWTGDAETECFQDGHLEFLELLLDGGGKVYRCPKSGLKIIVLKSTEEELRRSDEMGSKYLRIPGKL
jgi:hypothetical protein